MIIDDLSNKHANKMGFVLGAGPSLHFVDVSLLKPYVTITVNSSILKMPDCDYYASDDQGAAEWNYFHEDLKNSKCIKLFYEEKFIPLAKHFKPEEIVYFKHKWWFQPPNKYNLPDGLIMTKDPSLPIIGARTSVGTAVHLAHIMGCDPIVLLGCDCCFRDGNRYFWQYEGEKKAQTISKYRFSTRANRGLLKGKPVDAHCRSFIEYWENLAKINKDVNIIYASEGGILSCFSIMTIAEVIEKYRDKTK